MFRALSLLFSPSKTWERMALKTPSAATIFLISVLPLMAITFGAEGVKVAIHGRNLERCEAIVREITEAGGEALAVQGDVAAEAGCVALGDAVDQLLVAVEHHRRWPDLHRSALDAAPKTPTPTTCTTPIRGKPDMSNLGVEIQRLGRAANGIAA